MRSTIIFQYIFARQFYTLKKVSSLLAIMINVILLFYEVSYSLLNKFFFSLKINIIFLPQPETKQERYRAVVSVTFGSCTLNELWFRPGLFFI